MSIASDIKGVIHDLGQVGTEGGYVEAKTALDALDTLSWFDNFGEGVYIKRMMAICRICNEHEVFQYEPMYQEARDVIQEMYQEARDVIRQ